MGHCTDNNVDQKQLPMTFINYSENILPDVLYLNVQTVRLTSFMLSSIHGTFGKSP